MTALNSSATRRLSTVFEMLVRWYPADFRVQFEQEMRLTFQDWLSEVQTKTDGFNQAWIIFQMTGDLLPAIVREHFVEWREKMNGIKILQGFGFALLSTWAALWAWLIGIWVFKLPLIDPSKWLSKWAGGGEFSTAADNFIGALMFLPPFLALLAIVLPVLKVQTRTENGEGVLMLRLQKMGKAQALVAWVCLAATVVLWGKVLTSRLGWW